MSWREGIVGDKEGLGRFDVVLFCKIVCDCSRWKLSRIDLGKTILDGGKEDCEEIF